MKHMSKTGPAVVGLVVALLLACCIWQGGEWWQERRDDDRQESALQVAQDQVLDLTTLDTETVEEKLAAMQARTTGDFTSQLEAITASFVDAISEARLVATGTIDAAAVQEYDNGAAQVIVAASATVTNKKQPEPTTRSYRMSVHLVWVDDRWLIDGMEFVA